MIERVEKLREIAGLCGERAGQYDVPMLDAALTLNAWADEIAREMSARVPPQPEADK